MNGFVGHGWFGVSFHLRRIEDASVPSDIYPPVTGSVIGLFLICTH